MNSHEQISYFKKLLDEHSEKIIIRIENFSEFEKLMQILEELGFVWYGTGNLPTHTHIGRSCPKDIHVYNKEKAITHSGVGYSKEIPFNDLFSQRKKIKKMDIDPFEEENWGYIKENINSLRIGDRVELIGTSTFKNMDGIEGEILKIKFGTLTVNRNEHGQCRQYRYRGQIFLISLPNNLNWYVSIFNIKRVKNKKSLEKRPDIDPFGEESWYSIQENVEMGKEIDPFGEDIFL